MIVAFQPHRYTRTQALREEFGRAFKMSYRFNIRGPFECPLPGAYPVDNRLLSLARFGIVMRNQFRLVRGNIGEALVKRAGNAFMETLPSLAKQRPVRAFLQQGMLEDERLRKAP